MTPPFYAPHSNVASIAWPAIPDAGARQRLAVLRQIQENQWHPPEEIRRRQFLQLDRLLRHAAKTVPFYRQRLDELGLQDGKTLKPEDWQRVPLLTREDIQSAGSDLISTAIPAEHGKTSKASTSGSTGMPVTVVSSRVNTFLWEVMTLYEHLLHARDLEGRMAVIRRIPDGTAAYPEGYSQRYWSSTIAAVYPNGRIYALEIEASVAQQAEWLSRIDPHYLRGYPTNLYALARYCQRNAVDLPSLKQCLTFGELLLPHVREACREAWGIEIADSYSSQEVGYISLQAPGHDHHLVQSDLVLVEVLDRDGSPCKQGETGRVVVTNLHNHAMPIVRYDIGDFAEVGGPCPSGRGLPVLTRILGRERNMLVDRDGNEYWPAFGVKSISKIAPIKQFQLAQTSVGTVEARLVPERPLSDAERDQLRSHLESRLPGTVDVEIKLQESIPRTAGGKYEDFVNETLC